MLIASAVWVLCSVIFLDTAWSKVIDLRTAGQSVSFPRHAQVGFWIIMLGFWVWSVWTNWKRYRANEA
jgi:hypothetical protein